MSYILDALRKSQEQHELGHILRPAQGTAVLTPERPYLWPLIIGSGLVVALASVALWWYVKTDDPAVNPPPSPEFIGTATTAPTGAKGVQASELEKVAEPQTSGQIEGPVRLPAVKPAVDELVAQTRIPSPEIKPSKRARTSKKVNGNKNQVANAQTPARQTPVSDVRGRPGSGTTSDEQIDWSAVPFLRQMPDDFRNGLPDMAVNVHLYSADQSENLVYINNRQYRKGERIQDRIRLEEIVPEGVVLNYDGVRFKLPRPN